MYNDPKARGTFNRHSLQNTEPYPSDCFDEHTGPEKCMFSQRNLPKALPTGPSKQHQNPDTPTSIKHWCEPCIQHLHACMHFPMHLVCWNCHFGWSGYNTLIARDRLFGDLWFTLWSTNDALQWFWNQQGHAHPCHLSWCLNSVCFVTVWMASCTIYISWRGVNSARPQHLNLNHIRVGLAHALAVQVYNCTSAKQLLLPISSRRLISVMDPSTSWATKWLHLGAWESCHSNTGPLSNSYGALRPLRDFGRSNFKLSWIHFKSRLLQNENKHTGRHCTTIHRPAMNSYK